jgi:hypothetical protein
MQRRAHQPSGTNNVLTGRDALPAPQNRMAGLTQEELRQAAITHLTASGFGPRAAEFMAQQITPENTFYQEQYPQRARSIGPRMYFSQDDAYNTGEYETLANYMANLDPRAQRLIQAQMDSVGIEPQQVPVGSVLSDSGALSHELTHRLQNSEIALHPQYQLALDEALAMAPQNPRLGRQFYGSEVGVIRNDPHRHTDMRNNPQVLESAPTELMAYLMGDFNNEDIMSRRRALGIANPDIKHISNLYGFQNIGQNRDEWQSARQHFFDRLEGVIENYMAYGLPQRREQEIRSQIPRSGRGRATLE